MIPRSSLIPSNYLTIPTLYKFTFNLCICIGNHFFSYYFPSYFFLLTNVLLLPEESDKIISELMIVAPELIICWSAVFSGFLYFEYSSNSSIMNPLSSGIVPIVKIFLKLGFPILEVTAFRLFGKRTNESSYDFRQEGHKNTHDHQQRGFVFYMKHLVSSRYHNPGKDTYFSSCSQQQ